MENRTPDLRVANATLYQLSYDPTKEALLYRSVCRASSNKAQLAFHAVDAALGARDDGLEELRVVLAQQEHLDVVGFVIGRAQKVRASVFV